MTKMNRSKPNADAKFRRLLADSKEERIRNSTVRVDSRLLDKQLKLLEKDRQRIDKLYVKRKLELTYELQERQSLQKDVSYWKPSSAASRRPRSKYGYLPSATAVSRKMSLPLDLIPIGTEVVENWNESVGRPMTRPSILRAERAEHAERAERPERAERSHSTPSVVAHTIINSNSNGSSNGVEFRLQSPTNSCEYSESSSSEGSSRRNSHQHIPEYEMTPGDVKLRYNRRYSVNFLENGMNMEEKEARISEARPLTARSRLAIRRQSLPPDITRAMSRDGSMYSIKEDCTTPSEDSRFCNLMNALSQRFDASMLDNAPKVSRRRNSLTTQSQESLATSGGKLPKHLRNTVSVVHSSGGKK